MLHLSAAPCYHLAPIVFSNNATLHPYYLDLACLLCTHSETLLCFQRRLRLPRVVTPRALDRMHALLHVAHCQICCAVPLATGQALVLWYSFWSTPCRLRPGHWRDFAAVHTCVAAPVEPLPFPHAGNVWVQLAVKCVHLFPDILECSDNILYLVSCFDNVNSFWLQTDTDWLYVCHSVWCHYISSCYQRRNEGELCYGYVKWHCVIRALRIPPVISVPYLLQRAHYAFIEIDKYVEGVMTCHPPSTAEFLQFYFVCFSILDIVDTFFQIVLSLRREIVESDELVCRVHHVPHCRNTHCFD